MRGIQFLCFVWSLPLLAQLQLSTDQPSDFYQIGETATFQVSTTESGTYSYELYYDTRTDRIERDTFSLAINDTFNISYESSKAGVVFCKVTSPTDTLKKAVTFAPFDIPPLEDAPTDFDEYWEIQKSLVSQLNNNITLALHAYNTHSTTYSFSLPNIENRTTYGYITFPSSRGPFPVALIFPDYGKASDSIAVEELVAENTGLITIALSIYDAPLRQQTPEAYQPTQLTDRDSINYRYALTGAMNVINYLYTNSDFDGENICAMGVGQGGGLAALLAGIDTRVNLLIQSNPALYEHQGHRYQQPSGFPYYLLEATQLGQDQNAYIATANALKYYDALYASQRFKGTSYTLIDLENEVIPAATTFAGYNQLNGEKILIVGTEDQPTAPKNYLEGRYEFLRQHFPASPSDPSAATTTGYHLDIENPQTADANIAIPLNATIYFREEILDLPSQWTKVSGEGTVTFSDAQANSTMATFSQAGTYLLRLQARDERDLEKEGVISFLSDDIIITVSENQRTNNDSISLLCPSNQEVEIEDAALGIAVNWSAPQATSTCATSTTVLTNQIEGPASGSIFSIGTTTIQYEALDSCNNRASCRFTITINESIPNPPLPTSTSCLLQAQSISVSKGITIGGTINALIDGTGLSGATPDAIHKTGTLYDGVWLSDGTTPTFTLDLGDIQTVDGIIIWNYAYHHWQVLKKRGIKNFSVTTSTDGIHYSSEEAFIATITTDAGKGEQAQQFAFSTARAARFIQLKVKNAQNDASYVGLGEIRLTGNCGESNAISRSNPTLNATSQPKQTTVAYTLSPNPSKGQLYLNMLPNNNKPIELSIFNELGKQVFYQGGLVNSTPLQLQHLPKGLYFVQIQDQYLHYHIEKIIIH